MTEGRERKGNEADEYNRGQGRYCYLLSALDPWKHPHLRVFSLGCEHGPLEEEGGMRKRARNILVF